MRHPEQLDLAELMAMQPKRTVGPLAPGQRLPGGERAGIVRTQGSDFDSISPYMPGDDVRRIDWRATARSGRTQMRRVAASGHRARVIVLDLKDDLLFGTSGRSLAKTAALVAALKAWEALALNEPVGLAVADQPELAIPRRGQRQVERLLDGICREFDALVRGKRARQKDSLLHLIEAAATRLHRKDEICVIDEFSPLTARFRQVSNELTEHRSLYAYVLEDLMFLRPLPAGRYPFVSGDRQERHSVDLKGHPTKAEVDALRQAHRRALLACGWHVNAAVDLLPLHSVPPPDRAGREAR